MQEIRSWELSSFLHQASNNYAKKASLFITHFFGIFSNTILDSFCLLEINRFPKLYLLSPHAHDIVEWFKEAL